MFLTSSRSVVLHRLEKREAVRAGRVGSYTCDVFVGVYLVLPQKATNNGRFQDI